MFSFKAKSSKNITSGLTLSDDGIAFALISHSKKQAKLLHSEYVPCSNAEQADVLSRLTQTHQLDLYPCNVVLSPDDYQLIQVETPEVNETELQSALRWKIKDLIDFHIDDAVIDYLKRPGQASNNTSIEVVASRTSVVRHIVDLLQNAKVNLASIDIAELAVRNIIANIDDDLQSAAVLNLWEDYARISLYLNDDLYLSRSSSIGLSTLVHLQEDDDASLMIIDSLGLELQRTFDYYESHSRQAPISQLYIVNNAPVPSAIADLIQQRTGINCQLIQLDTFIEAENIDYSPECLLAIGAALRTEHN